MRSVKTHDKITDQAKYASAPAAARTRGQAHQEALEPSLEPFGEPPLEPFGEPSGDGLADAQEALTAALDKKAMEPTLLDVRGLCSYTNFFLVLSGRSDRHVDAVAGSVIDFLREERGLRPLGIEGQGTGHWVLIDFGDVIVHVFRHTAREHYDLEGLWIDAPRVPIEVPEDARFTADELYDEMD